ncbi:MAG: DUF6714 family protein [Hyphomicrobiaceae bacterium]
MIDVSSDGHALAVCIRSAFSDVFRPPLDVSIKRSHWEVEDIAAMLARLEALDATQILASDIENFRNSLSAFTPKGLAFVLPQFMLYAIKNPSSSVTDYTVYRLFNLKDENDGPILISLLSSDQKSTICKFLKFISKTIPDRDAMSDEIDGAIEFWCPAARRYANG